MRIQILILGFKELKVNNNERKRDKSRFLVLTHIMSLVYLLIKCNVMYLQRSFHSWVNFFNHIQLLSVFFRVKDNSTAS